jgi:hypothetical protein
MAISGLVISYHSFQPKGWQRGERLIPLSLFNQSVFSFLDVIKPVHPDTGFHGLPTAHQFGSAL